MSTASQYGDFLSLVCDSEKKVTPLKEEAPMKKINEKKERKKEK